MKHLILEFFDYYAILCKMVREETELIRKMPFMKDYNKYYTKSHKPIPLDEHSKPRDMLKDLLKDVTTMSDKLNEEYRSKFLDEQENSGDDLEVNYRSRRTRSSRRSTDRSRRRRDSGRRDSYEGRRSSRRSRR